MVIIEDTRQQNGKHDIKHNWFVAHGISLVRCKLPFGDYAPPPKVSIDTKRSIDEIAENIGNDHVRFKNECKAAQEAGCRLIVLVENDLGITDVSQVHTWENPRSVYSSRCIQGPRLQKAMEEEAIEAEKERIRAEKRAANPDGITENTSKKKLQKKQQLAEEAAKAAALKALKDAEEEIAKNAAIVEAAKLEAEAKAAEEKAKAEMQAAAELAVALEIDLHTGKNWYEAK